MGADEINPESVTPLYQQLTAILRGRIDRGELDNVLLSVQTIAQEYGVAPNTAGRAFGLLRDEGLIETVTGRGSGVVPLERRGKP